MKNKQTVVSIIIIFVAVMIGAVVLYRDLGKTYDPQQLSQQEGNSSAEEAEEKERKAAPDFVVYDIEGNEVRLSDYYGKPVVINFWASWCHFCKMGMPGFEEKYLELQDEVHFLMINVTDGARETVKTASEFIEKEEYLFPVFYDTDYSASNAYGAYSLPLSVFIDSEGYIAGYASGAISPETIQRGIDIANGKITL